MKRPVIFLSVIVFVLTFCACNNSNASNSKHIDEIKIVSHELKTDSFDDDYFEVKYKIQNTSNEEVTFKGISMLEYDEVGDVLDSYQSYNKASKEVDLEPNQSMYLELTFCKNDGITQIKNKKYTISINGKEINGVFSQPYIVDVDFR